MVSKKEKWLKAKKHLLEALKIYKKEKTDLYFLMVVKAFEILIESIWRDLKRKIEEEGLEANSPKMAIKQASKLKIISETETWLECLDARNSSVHDYFGITNEEYVDLANELLRLVNKTSFFSS